MTTPASKPHIKMVGSYYYFYLNGMLVCSWPTLESAWQRYREYLE